MTAVDDRWAWIDAGQPNNDPRYTPDPDDPVEDEAAIDEPAVVPRRRDDIPVLPAPPPGYSWSGGRLVHDLNDIANYQDRSTT